MLSEKPSDKVVTQLQKVLVRAVLSGQPLPGLTNSTKIPDLSFITNQPVIYLVDKNLPGHFSISDSPKPFEIISPESLKQEIEKRGTVSYLQFQPPEGGDNVVGVTLDMKISSNDSNQREMGLSSIHVKFSKVGNEWQATEEPTYLAS